MVIALSGFIPSLKAQDTYRVTFEFEGAGADSYITRVTANDEEVPNFKDGFDAPSDVLVQMYVSAINNNITVLANGVEPTWISFLKVYSFAPTENTVVKVVSDQQGTDPENYSINVDVNNHEAVELGYITYKNPMVPLPTYTEITLENNGVNLITLPDPSIKNVYVRARQGYTLKSVKANGEEVANTELIPVTQGMTLAIVAEEQNESTYTVKCNDYSQVLINQGALVLTSNEQTFPFTSGSEENLIVEAADGYEITNITLNGTPQEGGPEYYVTISESGSVLEITTKEAVAEIYHVSFEFEGNGAESYITQVTADDVDVPNFKDGFDTPPVFLTLKVAKQNKDIKVYFNDVEQKYMVGYSFYISENTVIRVVAPEDTPTSISFNVDVNNYEAVEFGYITYPHPLIPMPTYNELTLENNGVNPITLTDPSIKNVYVKAREGYTLKSVKVNGEEVANAEQIPVTEGMTLAIVAEEQKESTYTVKCDDFSHVLINNGAVKLNSNEETFTFISGTDVNVIISGAQGYEVTEVTLNGEPVEGGPDYYVTVTEDASVIEISTKELVVETYHVTFDFKGEGADSYITNVTMGEDNSVSDFKNGFDAPEGTFVEMEVARKDDSFKVLVNGEEPTFVPIVRKYNFVVLQNTVVSVTNISQIDVEITVNTAENIEVGPVVNNTPDTANKFELADGANSVMLPSGCNTIYVKAADKVLIDMIELNGVTVNSDDYMNIAVAKGDKITITTSIDDSVTGLEADDNDAEIYDLSGNRIIVNNGVKSLAKGIYIINGRKVIIK